MPNSQIGFGFQVVRRVDGASVTFQTNVRQIDPTYNTPIGRGDPVISTPTGYIQRVAAAPGTRMGGIFAGCEFFDTVRQQWMWLPQWPGAQSAANNTVRAYVIDDVNLVFRVRTSGPDAVDIASIGSNIGLAAITAPNISGYSTVMVDPSTIAATATLPFRIVGLGDGAIDNDPASGFNVIDVVLNNADLKQLAGVS